MLGLSRRNFLQYAGGAAGLAVLASCSSSSSSTERSSSGGPPRRGGVLTVAKLSEPTDLALFNNNAAPAYHVLIPAVFDTLLTVDKNFAPQPGLAESFDSGNRQLQLKLRKGVQFHSGREFTADDVRFTLERIQDPALGSTKYATTVQSLGALETPDKYTVVFKLESDAYAAMAALVRMLTVVTIVDKPNLQGANSHTTAIGTGPFKLEKRSPGQESTFVRNENYWMSGFPLLDGVTVKVVRDAQAINVALRSGSIMTTDELSGSDADRLKQASYTVTANEASMSIHYLLANTSKAALSDVRVRQALNYAIDRKKIASTSGAGVPTTVPWVPGSSAYRAEYESKYAFDLDKAKSLFSAAGVGNGGLEVLVLNAPPLEAQDAEILRANLATAGVKLRINQQPINTWVEAYLDPTKHELVINELLTDPDPAVAFAQAVLLRPNNDQTKYNDPRYVQLVQKILTAPDEGEVTELTAQATELLLDDCPLMPSMRLTPKLVSDSKVRDLVFTPVVGNLDVTRAWLSG